MKLRFKREGKAPSKEGVISEVPSPVITVAPVSKFFPFLFFTWYSPLLRLGWRRPLQHADLPKLPEHLTTHHTYPKFSATWEELLSQARQTQEGREKVARTEAGKYAMFLFRTLLKQNGRLMMGSIALQLLYAAFQFAGPTLLNKIVTFLQKSVLYRGGGTQPGEGRVYGYAVMMLIFPLLAGLAFVHASRLAIQVQVRVRAQLTAAVYHKALRLSTRARQRTEVGRIVNLMSADVNTVMTFFYPFANQLFSAPAMLITALILLIFQISWATVIGLVILLLSTPASGIFVRRLTMLRRDMLKHTDTRVKLTNQLLVGIRVLKIYAWEAAQEAAVNDARVRELGRLGAAIPARVGMQTLLFATPVLAAVASFAVYGAAAPASFTAARIFSSIALFGIMRIPLVLLPFALVELGNAFVSLRRLSQYLVMEEREDTVGKLPGVGVRISGGNFYWPHMDKLPPVEAAGTAKKGILSMLHIGKRKGGSPPATASPTESKDPQGSPAGTQPVTAFVTTAASNGEGKLKDVGDGRADDSSSSLGDSVASLANAAKSGGAVAAAAEELPGTGEGSWWLSDINLEVKEGELVCVVGRVGSGKSSLVNALLGEMCVAGGKVEVGGRIAYVAQQAWIVNDTVKENILFGRPLIEDHWRKTLHACSLESDLEIFPGGELTEIGEKGINLSGGQKQRISLARAVYADADLYIMDDPLSAVDVHVGRHIFDECIEGVLANKTRVLVTNQMQYLPHATHLIYLEAGRIAAKGTYDEVMSSPGFAALLAEFNSGGAEEEEVVEQIAPLANALSARSTDYPPPIPETIVEEPAEGGSEVAELRRLRGRQLVSTATFAAGLPRNSEGDAAQDAAPVSRRDLERIPTLDIERQVEVEAANTAGTARGVLGNGEPASYESALQQYAGRSGSQGMPGPGDDDEASATDPADRSHREDKSLTAELINLVAGRPSSERRRTSQDVTRHSLDNLSLSGHPVSARRLSESREGWAAPLTPRGPPSALSQSAASPGSPSSVGSPVKPAEGVAPGAAPKGPGGALVTSEDREVGSIGYGVYIAYAKMYGLLFLQLLVCLWASEQTVRVLTNWWLSRWTGAQAVYQAQKTLGIPVGAEPRTYYLGGYLGFSFAFVALVALRSTTNLTSALRASKRIHHTSLHHVVRAPVTFFDTTPIGRILNRFSKDMDDIDYMLPQSLNDFGNCMMQLLSTLIFISVIQPWFLCGVVPLMVVYFFIQKFYRRSYVELQRNDAVTRSPLYAHFSETLSGVDTIRAYALSQRFEERSDNQVDFNHRAYFALRTADQWLSLRLDVIGASLIFTAAILAVANRRNISPSLAALSLSEVLDVTGFLKFAVQMAAMFESRFNSVERLLTYHGLPQEAAPQIPDKKPPPEWPQEGRLAYRDVWLRYRPELDPVLKGVSFEVQPRDKIGIVGRTGSGKSSLIVALFRMVEPFKGEITLDGANLLSLGLEDVRGRIAAIPQDPVLFSGTVRSNLDPYSRHADHELWEALSHVALKDVVGGSAEGLEARVAEGGDNWSMGQRQLLCVARALLRRPRVLVADEATASVDGETDALIQRTIRANFADSTVLTIAHRLNTILDSSKVLVMQDGVRKEFGTVEELLGDANSTFRAMVVGAGLTDDSSIKTPAMIQ